MSRTINCQVAGLAVVGCGLWLGLSTAAAQSISDYSRAQRAVLEADITRNTARAMGTGGASTPGAPPGAGAPGAAPVSSGAAVMPPPMPRPSVPQERGMVVNGVITLATRSMVDLRNDGVSHLLLPGDTVPGTPWVVSSISAQRVVLKAGKAQVRTLRVDDRGL